MDAFFVPQFNQLSSAISLFSQASYIVGTDLTTFSSSQSQIDLGTTSWRICIVYANSFNMGSNDLIYQFTHLPILTPNLNSVEVAVVDIKNSSSYTDYKMTFSTTTSGKVSITASPMIVCSLTFFVFD